MAKKIEDQYKKLTDEQHVLHRPSMYIGSIKPHSSNKWILDDGVMIKRDVEFNPGFMKIFDEIITNSVDESKREDSKLNTIKVSIKNDKITIFDNGGIPVLKHKEHNEWIPEMIFSNMKSGSNFDDSEDRIVAGTNGVGSVCTNIFSKEFILSTCDGKNKFSQTFSDNMSKRSKAKISKSTRKHTEITFLPDYERFGMEGINGDHHKMIEKRIYDLAGCNPKLKIYFNDNLIIIDTFEDYVKLYTAEYFYETNKTKTWSVGVAVSDSGFQQISFANSTDTYDGGTHVDYIMTQIIVQLREYFIKKHKVDVKPSDIKSHITLFLDTTIVNSSFSSQTKEKLITEVRDFGSTFEISNKLIQSILKSEIVASILDWIEQKKKADDNKLARELNKTVSNLKVDKLIDAKARNRWNCSLGLFEGDSAIGNFRTHRDDNMGAFALRGKFINCMDISIQKLSNNTEAVNVMAAMGLKFGQKAEKDKLRYGKIYLYVDADSDGNAIAGLLLNFFFKFWPELYDYNMIYKVETPIVVVKNLKSKAKTALYNNQEYIKWNNGKNHKDWEVKYKKGLAALVDDEYAEIIKNPKLTLITADQQSGEHLKVWFGNDSDLRKDAIMKK
jgi:DNA topoisomerase-2